MRPTRPILLLALAGIALVLGLAGADLFATATGGWLPVPWSLAITLAAVAIALFGWTLTFRRRLRSATVQVDPFVAVRTAALAMAASRAGALIAGLLAGIGLWYASDLATSLARERLLACGLAVLAALATTVVALWLEHICRIREDHDDDEGTPAVDSADGDWVHPRSAATVGGDRPAGPSATRR